MLPSAESPGSCMCSMDGVGPGVVGVTQGHGGTRGAPLLSHHGGQACKRHQPAAVTVATSLAKPSGCRSFRTLCTRSLLFGHLL